jgi:hypothetical protein
VPPPAPSAPCPDLHSWRRAGAAVPGPVASERSASLHRRERSGPHHRHGRRGRRDHHLDGLPQRDELGHLRAAAGRGRSTAVDHRRRGAVYRRRRSGLPSDHHGRRGRRHRHVAGPPQRDPAHLRPAGERRRSHAVDRRRGGAVYRREHSVVPGDRRGRRGGRDRHLGGPPQMARRREHKRLRRHLRPARERRWGAAVDRRWRGGVRPRGLRGPPHDRIGRCGGRHRHLV